MILMGDIPLLGPLKGDFWARMALDSLIVISRPKKVSIFRAHSFQWICPHQNHNFLRNLNNRYINSYTYLASRWRLSFCATWMTSAWRDRSWTFPTRTRTSSSFSPASGSITAGRTRSATRTFSSQRRRGYTAPSRPASWSTTGPSGSWTSGWAARRRGA